jgi:hypothetical protein
VTRPRRLAQSPATPLERVRQLQTSLQAKAKAEPAFRFYSLWDKVCRADVLEEASHAVGTTVLQAATERRSGKSPTTGRIDGWKSCGRSCELANIGHSPCCACGYQRVTAVSAHSAYRASATAYPDEYLYETLGLYALPQRRGDLPSAKA